MSVLSDGTVPRCDQDWQGEEIMGDTKIASLMTIWRSSQTLREQHAHGRWNELTNCAGCHEWHRP
jgi:radical SAM protein with 4Fe4S-binding SPASM domain